MSNEIIQTFYERMMPLFRPQAEKLIESIDLQKMNTLAFRYTFSVEAMTKISHIIEDVIIATPRAADLHASFQYLSRLRPQQEKYQEVASYARGLWLYYEADVDEAAFSPLLNHPTVHGINTIGTPLANYWLVVAYGEGVNMSLLAQEIPSMSSTERYYEGFYTFEADTAYQILSILHKIYPASVPRPTPPDF
jgi:DICT domain-containing protein